MAIIMIEKNIQRTFSLKMAIQCFLCNIKKQKINQNNVETNLENDDLYSCFQLEEVNGNLEKKRCIIRRNKLLLIVYIEPLKYNIQYNI